MKRIKAVIPGASAEEIRLAVTLDDLQAVACEGCELANAAIDNLKGKPGQIGNIAVLEAIKDHFGSVLNYIDNMEELKDE